MKFFIYIFFFLTPIAINQILRIQLILLYLPIKQIIENFNKIFIETKSNKNLIPEIFIHLVFRLLYYY